MKLIDYMREHRISADDMAERVGGITAFGIRKIMYGERGASLRVTTRIEEVTRGKVRSKDLLASAPSTAGDIVSMRALPSEKAIQAAVLAQWRALGVPGSLVFAIPNAGSLGQPGLTRGPFDLCCIGGTVTIAFLELKRSEKDKLRPEQETFKQLLTFHGIAYAVTYGREQPIAVLEEWGIVKRQVRVA